MGLRRLTFTFAACFIGPLVAVAGPIHSIALGVHTANVDIRSDGKELLIESSNWNSADRVDEKCAISVWSLPDCKEIWRVDRGSRRPLQAFLLSPSVYGVLDTSDISTFGRADGGRQLQMQAPADRALDELNVSPDGRWMAARCFAPSFSCWGPPSADGVYLWAIANGAIATYLQIGDVVDLSFSKDSKSLILAYRNRCEFRDLESGLTRSLSVNPLGSETTFLALSDAGDRIALGSATGGVQVWDLPSKTKIAQIAAHGNGDLFTTGRLCFAGNDQRLVTSGQRRYWIPEFTRNAPYVQLGLRVVDEMKAWNTRTWKQVENWSHPNGITDLRPIPNSKRFLTVEDYRNIHIWQID